MLGSNDIIPKGRLRKKGGKTSEELKAEGK